jgi:hypothetical protein
MSNETYIKKINNLLSKKTYHYESEIYSFDYILELTGEIKPLISIGEWKDFYLLNFKIFNLNDNAKRIMSFIITQHPEYKTEDKEIYDIKKPLRQLGVERSLGSMARKMLTSLNIKETITKEVLVSLSELEGDYEDFKFDFDDEKKPINEGMIDRLAVRTVVRDIISVVKRKETGTWYLPEEINDELVYEFDNTKSSFSVELYLTTKDDIGGYAIPNAFFSPSDDVIEVYLEYNPETINQQLYDLVGELNEIITHELVHLKQKYTEGLKYKDVDRGALEYYTRKHEIPAQYHGYKRLAKLTKQPFEDIVRRWFDTHRKIHRLKPEEEEIVIQKILDYKP